jgi:hypothetical protein
MGELSSYDVDIILENLLESPVDELEILEENIINDTKNIIDTKVHNIRVDNARKLFGGCSTPRLEKILEENKKIIKKYQDKINKDNKKVVLKYIKKGSRLIMYILLGSDIVDAFSADPYRQLKFAVATHNAINIILEERRSRPDNWGSMSRKEKRKFEKEFEKRLKEARKEQLKIKNEEDKINMEPSGLDKWVNIKFALENNGGMDMNEFDKLIALEESIELKRESFIFEHENTIFVNENLLFDEDEDFVVLEVAEELFDNPELLEEGVKQVVKNGKDAVKGAVEKVAVSIDKLDTAYAKKIYGCMSDKALEKALRQNMKVKAEAEAKIKKEDKHPIIKYVKKGIRLGLIFVFPPSVGVVANTDPMRRLKIAVKCINAINLVKEERKNKSVKESFDEYEETENLLEGAMENLRDSFNELNGIYEE